jgi:HEAT repeat protein
MLLRLLRHNAPEVRLAAVGRLGRIGDERSVAALIAALDDEDFNVRLDAARGVARLTGELQWLPSDEAFTADETRFREYWKRRIPR